MTPIRKQVKINYNNTNMIDNKTNDSLLVIFPVEHIFIGKTKGKDKNNNMIGNKTTLCWSYFPLKHIFIGKTKEEALIRLHMFYKWYST